jgi:hypothetical protein
MKDATNTVLLWNPKTKKVRLVDLHDYKKPSGWRSCLACNPEVRAANFEERKTQVFIEAMHLIIRDKIPANCVHNTLLELDEYSEGCALDMPGLIGMRSIK